jgi:metal-responsive CopG/Arc/MetJ family transcriptional regulator
MGSKKINITIPEETLKEIDEFCDEEGLTKSFLIREAATSYIAGVREKKELEKKRKDMEWAIETSKRLRQKKGGFKGNKKGSQVIRKSRDRHH